MEADVFIEKGGFKDIWEYMPSPGIELRTFG